MNRAIEFLCAMIVGICIGMVLLPVCGKAFDGERDRTDILNPWWGQNNLRQEQERQEYRQQQYEQRRNPCP